MAKGTPFLRACCFAIATTAAVHTASGQISPRDVAPRPLLPVPKADSIPKPMFVGESAEETAQREAVERALDKNVEIAFDNTPLAEVAKRLSEISGLKVELDSPGLKDAGIELNTRVTLSLKQITLRSALKILLRRVDRTYVVKEGSLMITSPDKAATVLRTAIFPVADLIDDFDSSGRRIVNYESVIELLTSQAAPGAWEAASGPAPVKEYDGTLTLTQPPEVIEQTQLVLAALRIARERQSQGDFTPLKMEPENENTVRIHKALDATVSFDCRTTPLKKLAEMVAAETGVNALLDERTLVDAGVDLDTKVDGTAKDVPLRIALSKLLHEKELAFAVRDEVLFITTAEMASYKALVTYLYPLDDLDRGSLDDERGWIGENMVDLIASTVSPATWDGIGGPGNLYSADPWNVLFVTNTAEVQRDVADLLQKLRTMRVKQDRSALMHDEIETHVYRLGPPEGTIATTKEAEEHLKRSEVRFDPKELAAAICELVEPESWKGQGVDLRVLGDRVVVRHRRTIQAKVRQFLSELQSPEAIWSSGGGS